MAAPRNAPCPCGSGKKYKHCCGKELAARVQPSKADQARALELLDERLQGEALEEHCRRADALFLGPWARWLDPELLAELVSYRAVAVGRFCFRALDLPLEADGPTLAQVVLQEQGLSLSVGERCALEGLAGARLELYEVLAVVPGVEIRLRSPGDEDDLLIATPDLPRGLKTGDLLAARTIRSGPKKARIQGELYDYPTQHAEHVRERLASAEPRDGRAFFRCWMDVHAARLFGAVHREELRLASFEARFRVQDAGALARALDSNHVGIETAGQDLWGWTGPDDDEVLGGLLLRVDDELVVTAPSRRGLRGIRSILEAIAGAAVEHLHTRGPDPETRERPQTRYPYRHMHFPDCFDEGGLSPRVPKAVRTIALHLGRIVTAASHRMERQWFDTEVPCRRKPDRVPCGHTLFALVDEEERIFYECPFCGDAGTISSWQGTAFDRRREANREVAERLLTASLARRDHTRLLSLVNLTAPALSALASARPGRRGGVQIHATPDELGALARCIAVHFARANDVSSSAVVALDQLHTLFASLAGEVPDLSLVGQCAEVILLERSCRRRPRPLLSSGGGTHVLRVELEDISPPIWRRLELPSAFTLEDVYEALILAFGWADYHLHRFEIGDRILGVPMHEEYHEVEDERTVLLGDLVPRAGDTMRWEYDYGDSWQHAIVVEEIRPEPPARPRLLDGARACPPEDCGGAGGYDRLLAALRDPSHEDHATFREWAGEDYDPERFDHELLDRRVARMLRSARGVEVGAG